MLNTIGERQCEKALQLGKIFQPKEAFKIKLVDELVSSNEELLNSAENQIKKWIKIPSNFLANHYQTKLIFYLIVYY